VEGQPPRRLGVRGKRQRHAGGEPAFGLEARVLADDAVEAADEQPRADEHDHRHGHLGGDERGARPAA